MKAALRRLVDAELQIAGKVVQSLQRDGLCYIEIVSDEDSGLASAVEKVAQVLDDQIRAAVE
jgi:hypothetical protein